VIGAHVAERGQLLGGAAAEERRGLLVDDLALTGRAGERVLDLDEEPLVLLVAAGGARLHAHQVPEALEA
jgi:hypothetical protein